LKNIKFDYVLILWLLSFVLLPFRVASGYDLTDSQPQIKKFSFEKKVSRNVKINYLLYISKEYDVSYNKWPILLYLHGGKGRGDNLKKLEWYPVPKLMAKNDSLPFIILVPQCPSGEMWTDTDLLMSLLDEIIDSYRVDKNKVYLAGYSMGGHGTWYLAYKHPNRFAAIAPISGMSNPWWASRLKNTPIWAFHGAKDNVVPLRETAEMVKALNAERNMIKVSINSERGHSPPSEEEHLELFDWFLRHKIQ